MTATLHLVTPSNENRQVAASAPKRQANANLRPREYLTIAEVEKLMKAARDGRYGHRDATLILIAFRHGLRAVEICDLEWSQVEFSRNASLHVRRVKNGTPSVHPLRGDELRALRELRRQFPDSPFVFATERGGPFTADAINRQIKTIGKRAGLLFSVHAHMLRHACAMRWPMQGMMRDAFKAGWVIARYNTPCAIPSYRRHRSRTSGAAKRLRTSVYVADSYFKSIQLKISHSNLKRAKLTQGKGRGYGVPFPIGASSTESAPEEYTLHP